MGLTDPVSVEALVKQCEELPLPLALNLAIERYAAAADALETAKKRIRDEVLAASWAISEQVDCAEQAEALAKRREEERDAKERARLAQMEADRTGKTTSFIGSDGYRYIVDPQPEVVALHDALRQAVDELAKRGVMVAPEVRSLLNAEKSGDTHE